MGKITSRSCSEAQFVGFGSGTGTNLRALAEHQDTYRLRAIFSDKICPCKELAQNLNIPFLSLSSSYKEESIIEILERLQKEEEFEIDAIFLAGYMKILREPLLKRFENQIVNIHPGDLSIIGEDGQRLYTGKDAVLKAIICREESTRSTVHLVNKEVDGGKILYLSHPLKIEYPPFLEQQLPFLKMRTSAYLDECIRRLPQDVLYFAVEHQEKQKQACDWPSIATVAKEIASGKIKLSIG